MSSRAPIGPEALPSAVRVTAWPTASAGAPCWRASDATMAGSVPDFAAPRKISPLPSAKRETVATCRKPPHDAAPMLGYLWIEEFAAVRVEAGERAFLVLPHQSGRCRSD